MKKKVIFAIVLLMIVGLVSPIKTNALNSKVDSMLASMSNKDKITMMMMPSFRKKIGVDINYDNIKNIISSYEFAGVILFAENATDIESTMRFIDLLQDNNKNHNSQLFIGIDQEGGSVTRLGIGTNTSGNMALAATGDTTNAYNAGKLIASELKTLGINTNFAPVVDVNSNPSNPVIGIRSFSDDALIVSKYAKAYLNGIQSEGVMTSLKHFPGHGDTATDSHTGLSIVNKTYDELKKMELVPYKELLNSEMIMSAHIQFPNIEKETYVSKKDGETYTLPATLSKTILTDILRTDLGYNGLIVTDALDMGAIAQNFEVIDACTRAINAGADILLMPFVYDSQINEYEPLINELASKVGTEISEKRVNESVRRILTLKEKKGLLEKYDNTNLEANITSAKNKVSSIENHNTEFEIAKNSITMIKNNNDVLPLNGEDKTLVLYEYGSNVKAIYEAINKLNNEGININKDNIDTYNFYEGGSLDLDTLKEKSKDYKNIIMIHSLYNNAGLSDPDLDKMGELIDYIHSNNSKVIALCARLPYDVPKFIKADAIVLSYLDSGLNYNLNDYTSEFPKYGPNVIAAIYKIFNYEDNVSGILPVNIYNIVNSEYTSEVLFNRGFGLKYKKDIKVESNDDNLKELALGLVNDIYNNKNVDGINNSLKESIIKAVNKGDVININIITKEVNKEDIKDDVNLINKLNDLNIGALYDISINVIINNKVVGNINVLSNDIDINLEVPNINDTLKDNYKRVFYIVRVHNNEVSKLDTTLNNDILSTKSSLFSTYAIMYEDILEEKVPDTSDKILTSIVLTVISSLSLIGIYLFKNRF